MLYFYVSVAYLIINLLLAFVIMYKSEWNVISKFYAFCVGCVAVFGISAYLHDLVTIPFAQVALSMLIDFLFSLIPFFFFHFIVIFVRKYEILKSKWVIVGIYFAGLFSYTIVVSGLLPEPVQVSSGGSFVMYIYFITWMSVFFTIGIAFLYSHIRQNAGSTTKSGILLTGFSTLLLLLPSPFTYSLSLTLFQNNAEWYGATSIVALIAAVYLLFRHKVLVTIYDSVKSALLVMDDLFIMTDKAFQIQVARGAVSNVLGYSEREMVGKNLNEYLGEKEYITSYLEYVAKGRMKECRFDTNVRTKQGKDVIINFSFSPVIGEEQIDGFVGIGRDITERKQQEKQLRLLAKALETTSEMVWITDSSNRIVYINHALEESFGYTLDDIHHRHPIAFFSPTQQDRILFELASKKTNQGWSGELTCRRKDGTEFPALLSTSLIESEEKSIIGYVGVARDIREYKEIQEQLRQAQKLESVGTLAGGIAHDFNNILAIIMSYDSILARGKYTQEGLQESIRMIRSAVDRGASIVRQLLTVARKSPVEYGPVSINNLILEMVNLLKETFPKVITISARMDTKIPEFVADQSQIEQVILNLCVNARDAMPKGGNLTVSTYLTRGDKLKKRFPEAAHKEYVQISVTDTGTGIEEDIREKIFEPFYTTKDIGKGTGLGLSVVYGVIQSHKGFIDLESEPGKGTTFHVYLPLIEEQKEHREFLESSMGELLGARETILVIEDEEALLKFLKNELTAAGYRIILARDGVEGLNTFKAHQNEISVVISDLGLPKMGGWECFLQMKEIDPDVKIIITSGYIDADLQSMMDNGGVQGHVIKPYTTTEILVKIRELLSQRR